MYNARPVPGERVEIAIERVKERSSLSLKLMQPHKQLNRQCRGPGG